MCARSFAAPIIVKDQRRLIDGRVADCCKDQRRQMWRVLFENRIGNAESEPQAKLFDVLAG